MARYEKTIAGKDYLFAITIPNDVFTTVYDCLDSTAQQMIDGAYAENNIVDGYVVCYTAIFSTSRVHGDAGIDIVAISEKYLCPMEFWVKYVTLKAATPTAAVVRIFIS
jgi:hypothetical protein